MKVCMKYRICKNIEQKYRIKIWKTVKKLFAHKNQFFFKYDAFWSTFNILYSKNCY